MKTYLSILLFAGLAWCGALGAAPTSAPVPATGASAMPCMQGGKMANSAACPGMQGGMGPGMMGKGPCPGGGKGPCPGMRSNTAAPAASRSAPAGTSNPTVYGWQLMTPQERVAYRAQMRAAKTAEERAKICTQHHQEMQDRAKQKGVTLPAVPPCS